MPALNIRRGNDGRIFAIDKIVTDRDYQRTGIFMLGFMLMGWGMLSLAPKYYQHYKVVLGGVLLIGAGLSYFLGRLFNPGPKTVPIANKDGVNFQFYRRLGTVPWSAIRRFTIVPAPRAFLGKNALVAELIEPSAFIARLGESRFGPNGGAAIPFATLTGSRSLDISALQAGLSEMRGGHS